MIFDTINIPSRQNKHRLFWLMLVYLMFAVAYPILFRKTILFLLYSLFASYLAIGYLKQNYVFNVCFIKKNIWFFLFIFICILYLIPSFLFSGWSNDYFYNSSFILRHAYFIIFFPVYIAFGMAIYHNLSSDVNSFLLRRSLSCLCLILTIDIITAILFGNTEFREWNGYTFFLEKAIIWYIVCYIFFFSLVNIKNKFFLMTITSVFFILQRSLGYGHMFNAATGIAIYIYMLFAYLLLAAGNSRRLLVLIFETSIVFVLLFIFITPFFSDAFISDENTYWRLEAWKSNLESVYQNYGFGSGFGTSYFPNEIGIIDEVYRYWIREGQVGNMIDYLFIRGQHSSLVNIFFRTGFLGLICFLFFINTLCRQTYIKTSNNEVLFLFSIFICGFFNISVHVGLESPLFLITLGISIGSLIYSLNSYSNKPLLESINLN